MSATSPEPDPQVQPDPQAGDKPDFLLDQFKSVEDQAKAYSEARNEMNRVRAEMQSERETFAAALEAMQAQPPTPPQQYDPQADPLLARYEEAFAQGDARTALAIQMHLMQQAVGQTMDQRFEQLKPTLDAQTAADREHALLMAEQQIIRQFGGEQQWSEIAPDVKDLLAENHWLDQTPASVEGFTRTIDQAASIVQARRVLANAERDAQARVEKMMQAGPGQGAPGRIAQGTQDEKDEWAKVKAAQLGGYANIVKE